MTQLAAKVCATATTNPGPGLCSGGSTSRATGRAMVGARVLAVSLLLAGCSTTAATTTEGGDASGPFWRRFLTGDDGDDDDERLCDPGATDTLLIPPLGPSLPLIPVYFILLMWSFMGVGIIADVFMAAIEVITSKEETVRLPDGTARTYKVWNATVANLTLMALGSSAPEIILSVLETVFGSFYSGELGPSTIVGSAAFNLFVIIAVCVVAIPPGDDPRNPDGRKIADLSVFAVTATASVFAYVWLLIILVAPPSKHVVTFYEGFLTFIFFPILVVVAYAADKGYFSWHKVQPSQHIAGTDVRIKGSALNFEQCGRLLKQLETAHLSDEEVAALVASMSLQPVSRARHRRNAIRKMTGGKPTVPPAPSKAAFKAAKRKTKGGVGLFFGDGEGNLCETYHAMESWDKVSLTVMRIPAKGTLTVDYYTEGVTATEGKDFEKTTGTLTFEDGEATKAVDVKIFDDEEVEEDESFKVKLHNCSDPNIDLSGCDTAEVTIVDDDDPGALGFEKGAAEVTCSATSDTISVNVHRYDGCKDTISCKYRTADKEGALSKAAAAREGVDYEKTSGELIFHPGEVEKTIKVQIIDGTISEEKHRAFEIELYDVKGPVERVSFKEGHPTKCVVSIMPDESIAKIMALAKERAEAEMAKYNDEPTTIREQISAAFEVEVEQGEEATTTVLVMHYITLPWKLLFAICPPPHLYGGWLCFSVALGMIGFVTALIGDLANLFGCSLTLTAPTTAITFVALGTSLPDTFASKAAAVSDDTADAAVGNVTGSNAVNVFLGLGLPFLMASAFWEFSGSLSDDVKEKWYDTYKHIKELKALCDLDVDANDEAAMKKAYDDCTPLFAVPAGALETSVTTFCVCALVCFGTLAYRRKTYGYELGGPERPAKRAAGFFICLWLVYIVVSIVMEPK